ncbi:glucan endo-1,3-beta-glucosidase 1-like [Wolffia australiana]
MAEFLFLLLPLFLSISPAIAPFPQPGGPFVGVNLGQDPSKLPAAAEVAALLKRQRVTHVRLLQPDEAILSALSFSGVNVCLCVPNSHLVALATSPSSAISWVSRYVLRFHPHTLFTSISVGEEVLTSSPSSSLLLLPAMTNLASAIAAGGLQNSVKISIPLSFSAILNPFPPSAARFNDTVLPVLRFLSKSASPLMLNLYPNRQLARFGGSALFEQGKELVDPENSLHYVNVYDAMIDAAYSSLSKLGLDELPVVVTETGWPHGGEGTREEAKTYVSNLIRHVLVKREGTPRRPEITPSVYVFKLFDEGGEWGIFGDDGRANYELELAEGGGFMAEVAGGRKFCVAAPAGEVDERALLAALDWACGPGKADCSGIQPGEACYVPRTARTHASYAFNSYYQQHGKAAEACQFQGAAMVTTTDPSHGRCIFAGSELADDRARVVANTTGTQVASATVSLSASSWLLFFTCWLLITTYSSQTSHALV